MVANFLRWKERNLSTHTNETLIRTKSRKLTLLETDQKTKRNQTSCRFPNENDKLSSLVRLTPATRHSLNHVSQNVTRATEFSSPGIMAILHVGERSAFPGRRGICENAFGAGLVSRTTVVPSSSAVLLTAFSSNDRCTPAQCTLHLPVHHCTLRWIWVYTIIPSVVSCTRLHCTLNSVYTISLFTVLWCRLVHYTQCIDERSLALFTSSMYISTLPIAILV